MDNLVIVTNYLGYGQYVNEAGEYICPLTGLPYTNEGAGVLSYDPDQ